MTEAVQEEEVVVEEEAAPEVEVEGEKQEEKAEGAVEGTKSEPSKEEKPAEAKNEVETGDVTVTIGEEKPAEKEEAPGWVKEVRKQNRELAKRNRELEAQIAGQTKAPTVGKKPEMSDPDIDYDAEKFEKALAAYFERKRSAEAEQQKIESQQKTEQAAWQTKLDAYGNAKTQLKVPDLDEAEALVQETLSERQQAIILKGAKNPALLVYALGKNPAKLQELAKTTDLVEFAFAVANVESQLKITKKPAPPAPEKKIEGSGPKSGAVDSQLERLRAEAARTGDHTKVLAYKRQQKAA